MDNQQSGGSTGAELSNTAQVSFAQFGDRSIQGKVDTGATTSSLHATNITVNKGQNTVTFQSALLSPNMITLDLEGAQEVHSADAGGTSRPMVKMDVTVDGTPIRGAVFNLNDRGNMDSDLLIGQNILKAGSFTINPNKPEAQPTDSGDKPTREAAILAAVEVLAENDVSLAELVRYMRTVAVNQIKE